VKSTTLFHVQLVNGGIDRYSNCLAELTRAGILAYPETSRELGCCALRVADSRALDAARILAKIPQGVRQ